MASGYISSNDQLDDIDPLHPFTLQFDNFDDFMAASEVCTQPTDLAPTDLLNFEVDRFNDSMATSDMYTQPTTLAPTDFPSFEVDQFNDSMATSEMYTQPTDLAPLDLHNCQCQNFKAIPCVIPYCHCQNLDTIPCPGNTYYILDKASGKALRICNNQLSLTYTDCSEESLHGLCWLCVETDNCYGFFNEITGMYVGYNNDRAGPVESFDSNSRFSLKPHIDGGFQLVTATGSPRKQVAVSCLDDVSVTRQHGGNRFMFNKVQRPS